jgi:hypothetical protein
VCDGMATSPRARRGGLPLCLDASSWSSFPWLPRRGWLRLQCLGAVGNRVCALFNLIYSILFSKNTITVAICQPVVLFANSESLICSWKSPWLTDVFFVVGFLDRAAPAPCGRP